MAEEISFHNHGSTCYANALLQCLISCKEFVPEFSKCFMNTNSRLCLELQLLLTGLRDDTRNFLRFFSDKMNVFSQNDIAEFFMIVVSLVNEHNQGTLQCKSDSKYPLSKNTLSQNASYIIQTKKMNELWDKWESQNKGCWNRTFFGQMISQITCMSCKEYNQNNEMFNMISIPIPKMENISKIDIWQCLKLAFEDETIEGWKCDHCKDNKISKKSQRLWSSPEILVIQLKRFDHNRSKNNSPVHMPISFTMNRFLLALDDKFTLISVACHIGSLNSGHYYTIRKTGDQWNMYDDDHIYYLGKKPCIEEISRNGYLFFYKLVHS